MIEQKEAANEELRAANEEVICANEELQSSNEEMTTAQEELQAMNEELSTVNDELQNRIRVANQLGDDLVNLVESTRIPIVVLGADLCVRRFTPSAEQIMKLRPGDVGRPLSELKAKVNVPDLEELVRHVLDTMKITEREVLDETGAWHKLYIRPYKTLDDKVAGVVIMLFDIDALKRREREINDSRDYAVSIVETVREPLLVLDSELRVRTANRAFYQSFQVSPAETEGSLIYRIGGGEWNIPRLRSLLEELLSRNAHFENFEVDHFFPGIGQRTMLLNAHRVVQGEGRKTQLILLAIEDITDRREAERLRHETEDRLRAQALEQEVIQAATLEQQRMGQELHDTSAQELTALGLLAESLVAVLKEESPVATGIATKMAEGIKRVLGQVRAFSRGLICVELDANGLMAALATLASETTMQHGVPCTFECESPVQVANNQMAVQLYGIAREAVTNAIKHAQPRNIKIALESGGQSVNLRVTDDGLGMPNPAVNVNGLGLRIMRYRASLINARLSAETNEPRGTVVTCTCTKDA